MGINRDTVKAYGDYAETYPDGEPNGVIKEQVLDAVKVKLGAPSLSRLLDLMLEHQTDLFEQGITSIQSDDFKYSPEGKAYDLMELLRAASEDGRLKVRYAEQVQLPTKQEINQFFEEKRFGHFSGGPGFRLACVKILSDGSLGARTALMRKPYADAPSVKGIGIYETQEELDELVSIAHRNNMPVAIHAIGDGAIERCLDAIERAQRSMPYLHPRHGIVHCQITDRALLQRFRDLDVIAFIQPIFIDYDRKIVFDRVGSELGRTSYAWRDLIESGVHAPFGTDCPVESFRPMPGLYCAVSRCGLEGGEPFLPQQRLTREQALFGYTAAGAYSTGDETIKGEIRGGMLADFVIFDTDLLTCSERAILDAKVLSTYIGGECVYREK